MSVVMLLGQIFSRRPTVFTESPPHTVRQAVDVSCNPNLSEARRVSDLVEAYISLTTRVRDLDG
eukprot:758491-Hanusia_phi.AAC.2